MRIAKGSGNSIQDINRLIKQFKEMGKMMKMFKNNKNLQRAIKKGKGK